MNAATEAKRSVKEASYRLLTAVIGDDEHMVTLPTVRGPAKGLRFRLDLVGRREAAYFWGKYDRKILFRLSGIVRDGSCIWDCGTYLGFYTCFFARAVGKSGRVVAIEPDPRNLDRTLQNVALNGLTNVIPANLAVGSPAGEVDLLVSNDSNSHLPMCYVGDLTASTIWRDKDRTLPCVRVKCVSLDQVMFEECLPRPDLIKMDIEGAERDALKHMDRITREVRPIIVLELHNPECDAAAWQFALSTGYALYSLDTQQQVTSAADVRGTLICFPPDAAPRTH